MLRTSTKVLNPKQFRKRARSHSQRWSLLAQGCSGIQFRFKSASLNQETQFRFSVLGQKNSVQNNVRSFCTKPFSEDDPVETIGHAFTDAGNEFEGSFWAGTEDDLTHLRINLYPKSSDQYVLALFEATTVQEILDIINSIPPDMLNEKHSSQALVSLWDLQKLLFRIGPSYDPVKDFTNRKGFVEKLKNHPIFSEPIVNNVLSRAKYLEDEPLAASLLCLKRFDYCMKSSTCQKLIEECLRRKDDFCLPAVSRLAVCMKAEGTYGALVMVAFLPYVMTQVEKMNDDDLSIRLVSITLRNIHRLLPTSIVQSYRNNIQNLLKNYESKAQLNLEIVTLCKILLCLMETRLTDVVTLETSPRVLMREIGKKIAMRSNELSVIDILSLHRFLESGPQEPMELIDALFSKISTLIEDDHPRLDIITCIVPFVKSLGQRQHLANFVHEYLDHYPKFEPVSQVLLKILKVVKLKDGELYNKYWSKATELLQSTEMTRESTESSEIEVRRVLKFTVDYLGFNQSLAFTYRHLDFEIAIKNLLTFYLENHEHLKQPTIIYPTDLARTLTFLIAFGEPNDPIFTENKFLELIGNTPNFKVADIHLLARGIEVSLFYHREARRTSAKYYNKIKDLCTQLENCVRTKLLADSSGENPLTTIELVSLSKLHLSIKRAFGESPVFSESVKKWTLQYNSESIDSRLGREMATTLLCSNYNSTSVFNMLQNFIYNTQTSVNPDLAEKFVCLAYSIGHQSEADETADDQINIFDICHTIFERHIDQFQPYSVLKFALGLCFYRTLQTSVVHNIFSIQFLDQVDEELAASVGYGTYPVKVRQAFMELNRAVCIDMPDSNVPWFHQKFCEDVVSVSNTQEQYIHKEICMVLGEVLNDPAFVKRQIYSPYFYLLDFLVEFDTKGRPIKPTQKKKSIFSLTTSENTVEINRKVAILVLPPLAFTRNERQIKGFYKLRKRHLEILGYQVVEIDPRQWNSMYMSEPMAKNDFLESSIFPSHNNTKTSKVKNNSIFV